MNNEISPIGIMQLLDTTKAERGSFVAQVISAILGGNIDPVNVHLQVKCMEEICKAIKEHPDYKPMLLDSAAKYGRNFEFHNAKIDIRSSAGRWSFDHDSEHAALKAALKNREEYLKAIKGPVERITADGEVVTDMPAVYTPGEETVYITLK